MKLRLAPFLLSAVVAAAGGCGRKLPPVAPLQVLPARVEPLRVEQQASDAVLRFPYPSRTSTGGPLSGLTKVTIYRELLPAPAGSPPPPSPTGDLREREERLFLARAEKIRELTRRELDDATSGGDLLVRDSLSALFTGQRLGKVFLRYGVTVSRDRKRVSELSPLVAIRPLVPPSEPGDLTTLVGEGKVCLEWKRPETMLDGSRPVTVGAYAVYRREYIPGAEAIYEDPVAVEKMEWFLDTAVLPDRNYFYTVRAAPSPAPPIALGPPAAEAFADTRDVFPPSPPEGFQVLPEADGNRLVWNPVLAPDLDHYTVYRREGTKGEWQRLPLKLGGTTWFDPGAPVDTEYSVSAMDRAGNESSRTPGSARRTGGDR